MACVQRMGGKPMKTDIREMSHEQIDELSRIAKKVSDHRNVGRWPLDMPLIRFSPVKEDDWTIGDSFQGVAIFGENGSGKCLGKSTPVMLASGEIVPVEKISVGDLLMGDNGTPRTVLSTHIGRGKLYKISPTNGGAWICNDQHILTLRYRGKRRERKRITISRVRMYDPSGETVKSSHDWNEIVDIPVAKYLKFPRASLGFLNASVAENGYSCWKFSFPAS